MRILIAATALALATVPAHSLCYERLAVPFDLASEMEVKVDYLVCLHNQQTERLNEQARLLNAQTNEIAQLKDEIHELRKALADLEDVKAHLQFWLRRLKGE